MRIDRGASPQQCAPSRVSSGRSERQDRSMHRKGNVMNRRATAISLALLAAVPANAQSTQISPNGSRPSAKGAPQYFTGSVIVDPLYAANDSTSSSGGLVTFEPGARSAWHTHPAGQYLIVTSGTGWVQEEGGQKREIKPGDVIWTPPGVRARLRRFSAVAG
jgi:quercetin dioxygenase-like cupin family protein